ncbi:MAG: chromate resistance protein [Planctomycetes bacterium]|nr:chromate resistance protein [Planctomycetota bacterium]
MEWNLLVLTLPTENTAARMRSWRALKASGATVLRDGVYLMPDGGKRKETLQAVAHDVEDSGGTAYLLEVAGTGHYPLASLFDRSEDYRRLADEIGACVAGIETGAPQELARQARKLHKTFEHLSEIDFFPGEARCQVQALLLDLDRSVQARISPDEPTGQAGAVLRRSPNEYQLRLWATRKDLWVDRLASAWLIRRFIDPAARFLWLDSPADCPPDVLGFDFDGARFSHTVTEEGLMVTFETLVFSFGMGRDAALRRIARIVHYLDAGGLPAPEAAGLEGLLRGMKSRLDNDDALLLEFGRVFDDLYCAFGQEKVGP